MIIGSIYVTIGAIIIGVPIGLFCAVYLAYFCPEKIYKIVKARGEPDGRDPVHCIWFLWPCRNRSHYDGSVRQWEKPFDGFDFAGYHDFTNDHTVSESSIRAVPVSYYEGALGLGASKERAVFFSVLPAAKSGIMAGIILGVGRAIGETMAVIMVAGNQPLLPESLTSGVRTLTANVVIEMGYATGLHRKP